ncbi:hypothetical protein ACA910_005881 [Epithemia clementina (nom. ined.)]
MGNEASSEGRGSVTVESPSADGVGGFRDSSNSITVSPGATRRIVKAVKPLPSPGLVVPDDDNVVKGKKGKADDDENGDGDHKRNRPLPVHETPAVTRELELEKLKEQKQERLETMQEYQRARREKRLEERRHRNPGGNPNEGSAEEAVAAVKPNPFSKFLSVFSVESKYPEHKRSYEVSEDDEPEPEIKKPRAAEEEQDGEKGRNSSKSEKSNSFLRSGIFAATAAAAVAIAAGALLRASRSKM